MPAELRVEGEPAPIELAAVLSIGRAADNGFVIGDSGASRHHAVILERAVGEYELTDLGSRNGTFVNGKRLMAAHGLEDNDLIEIGGMRIPSLLGCARPTPAVLDRLDATSTFHRHVHGSILVADIRGFTSLSEKLPPTEVAQLLARWFSDASRIIDELHGTVDKVIGDALLAYWPRLGDDRRDVNEALTAARELIECAASHERELAAGERRLPFRIGCGIHCGTVAMGSIGRHAARDFTIIGDAVNIAFRIEALCKALGRVVLVSSDIRAAAGADFTFEDAGLHEIRGKAEPLNLFALKLGAD